MSPFRVLFRLRCRLILNRLRSLHQESHLKIAAVIVLGMLLWSGLFLLFYRGFVFLQQFPGLSSYVVASLLALFFFSLFIMLAFSNGIIAYSSLYRSQEASFLLSKPLPFDAIFLHKFFESIAFSSWAFLLLGMPLLLAYGIVERAGLAFFLLLLPFFASFILVPAGLGNLGALLIAVIAPGNARRVMLAAGAALGVFGLWLSADILLGPRGHDPYTYEWMSQILDRISFVQNRFAPSFWAAHGLLKAAQGDWMESLFQLGLLASNGLMISLLVTWTAQCLYTPGWSRVQGNRARRKYLRRGWLRMSRRALPLRLLMDKDFIIFRRDPVQWSQCAILFGLLAIYILNLRTFAFDSEKMVWRNWTSFLNLTATCLVLATLTTRFIFPLLSLEGKRFWVIGLLPIRRDTILYGKFLFSFAISLVVSEILIVLSNIMLRTQREILLLHTVTVFLICLALSGMSVGLSALYPNMKEDNPSKIVSGFGGTLNLIFSLIYVVLVITFEAVPCHLYFSNIIDPGALRVWMGVALVAVVFLTVLACALPLWLGIRALNRMEL